MPPNPKEFERATRELPLARHVRRVVEVALGVGRLVVDRRRNDAVADREREDARLEAARGAEEVPGHRLRRGDRERSGRGSPKTRLMAIVSIRSPCGVEVPWALT